MKRSLLIAICLIGAVACYFLGYAQAAIALFVVGGLLELVFWVLVLGGFQKKTDSFEP
ncbi:MAG: hypothetical protein AAGF23_10695 [Acidobacteriota bacterium]